MAMTRLQLKRAAAVAAAKAAKDKPLDRRRVKAFMEPITKAFALMLQGDVMVDQDDIPITRLPHNDQWEPIDACIEGFVCAMKRVMPDIDFSPIQYVSSDLRKGKLMTPQKAKKAYDVIRMVEDRMTKLTWRQVADATNTTMIDIKMEELGLKGVV